MPLPPPPSDAADAPRPYVSRGGLKLEHALTTFGLEVSGLRCADLGASTGGFTDCLLRQGAQRVWAVETGYGVLDYRLRIDERVEVMERTNALHAEPPEEPVDLVVADLSWTRQRFVVPAARRWLGDRPEGRCISLIKPHYEVEGDEEALLEDGILPQEASELVLQRVLATLPNLGARVLATTPSPIRGSGKRRRRGRRRKRQPGAAAAGSGNIEYLALLAPEPTDS
ncbi:MAG: SAM-dependent methyltransferase [Acidobacteriota bacterium]